MARKARKSRKSLATLADVAATEAEVAEFTNGHDAPPPAVEPAVLDPTDPDGVGGFEPTERSIVKRKYRRLYAPNNRSCDDRMARELRAHLFDDEDILDFARLVRFAKANDCWQDTYSALNPGQVRMNVGNRLRAKVRKGHEVVWAS